VNSGGGPAGWARVLLVPEPEIELTPVVDGEREDSLAAVRRAGSSRGDPAGSAGPRVEGEHQREDGAAATPSLGHEAAALAEGRVQRAVRTEADERHGGSPVLVGR
jgi:hypothetical protein